MRIWWAGVSMVVASCYPVPKSPNDMSKPTVQIKVQGADRQFKEIKEINLPVGGSVKLMCIASDPQGIKSIHLSFTGQSQGCNIDGSVWSGSFSITPMPASLTQNLGTDPNGQVLTSVPLIADLNGPFECAVFKPPCAEPGDACSHGQPYGGAITVTCTAENWASAQSAATAQRQLSVHLQ